MMKKTDDNKVIRVAILPVAEPVGASWKELGDALHLAWQDSTSLSNWAAVELVKTDAQRKSTDAKLKAMKPVNLYRLGFTTRGFWGVDAWNHCKSSANCVLRRVEKAYRKARFNIIWRASQVVPWFRYPQPYPVHNAEWKAELIEGKPHVRFNLKGERWLIRLKSGAEFGRQLAIFRQIVNGAKQCELTIYRQGSQKHTMVKLACWVPKPEVKTGHTMLVRTDPNAFWVVEMEGRQPWILNADHVRRWQMAHKTYLQRISEDTKREKRWPRKVMDNINKARDLRCEKNNNRLDSWAHEATAMLAAYATRNGVGEVIYDDSNKDYLPSFPWHTLKTKLKYKLEAAGLALMYDTREVADV